MKPLSNRTNRNRCMGIFGVTSFTLGIILLFLKIWLIELLATSLIVLKPNSIIEKIWRKIPDVPLDVYLFNWTNHEDFHNISIKPKFQQVGPYRFRQDIEKVDVVWNSNDTVTYSQERRFHFDEKSTNKNVSETITTLNGINLALSYLGRNMNYLIKKLISAYLATSAPYVHITRPTKQFLFEGLDNIIIDMGHYFPFVFSDIPRFDKFNFLSIANKSKSFEGIYNIENGVNGIFEIRNWNFYNVTPYFTGSSLKVVHGSAGELYSRKLSKDYIGIFIAALCRYVQLDFEEEVIVNGIVGYKYSVGNRMLDNGTLIPGNECYCAGECIPSGMVNTTYCRYGLPIFVSLPNFYSADPVYLDGVEGLQPDKARHEAYVIVEPKTGIPLKSTIRIQVNILLHSIEDIGVFEDVREIFFPMLWIDQRTALPGHIHTLLKIYLMIPDILTGIASILITLGLVLISISFKHVFVSWFKKIRKQKQCTLPIPEEIPFRLGEKKVKTSNIRLVNKSKNFT